MVTKIGSKILFIIPILIIIGINLTENINYQITLFVLGILAIAISLPFRLMGNKLLIKNHELTIDNNVINSKVVLFTEYAKAHKWNCVLRTDNKLIFETPFTWKSFGEIVTIDFVSHNSTISKIQISSYSKLTSTKIDYGKNELNINQLLSYSN